MKVIQKHGTESLQLSGERAKQGLSDKPDSAKSLGGSWFPYSTRQCNYQSPLFISIFSFSHNSGAKPKCLCLRATHKCNSFQKSLPRHSATFYVFPFFQSRVQFNIVQHKPFLYLRPSISPHSAFGWRGILIKIAAQKQEPLPVNNGIFHMIESCEEGDSHKDSNWDHYD